MGNAVYHNKWHGFNHHTVPTDGFPDSAIDPIASNEFPFAGLFFNNLPLSAVDDNVVLYYVANSFDWYMYYTITKPYSSDWNLWNSVRFTVSGFRAYNLPLSTTRFRYENWNDGAVGYTYWSGVSSNIFNAYITGLTLSSENVWPLLTEGTTTSGRGWHIALSGITFKTNVSAVNTRQKNFGPVVRLTPNLDNTLFWDVSTAQVVYLTLTENRSLTATRIFNTYRGGKYTMYILLDFCPEENMNVIFDKSTYRVEVSKFPKNRSYRSFNNVVSLSANNVTRIDFTYDGSYMLGKATHYKIFLPTTDDLYYQGQGNTLETNPQYISGLSEPDSYISPGPGIRILPFSDQFTAVSAIYISGSGTDISYFGQGTVLFTMNMIGANWPSLASLTENRGLTASFDRVYANLSGGDYRIPEYADNLFGTPARNIMPELVLSGWPIPPYQVNKLKSNPVPTCLSALEIIVATGRDRDINRVVINNAVSFPLTPTLSGEEQRYNFSNERQALFRFQKVQRNFRFDVYFEKQAPLRVGAAPILWFDPIDNFTITKTFDRIQRIISKPDKNNALVQNTFNNRPFTFESATKRSLAFTTSGNITRMTLSRPLTSIIPISQITNVGSKNITTFTAVHPLSVTQGAECVLWWIGDYKYGPGGSMGYGVALSGDKICFGGLNPNSAGLSKINNVIQSYKVEKDKPFLLTTVLESRTGDPRVLRSTVYLNGSRLSSIERGLQSTIALAMSSYNMIFGASPELTNYSNYRLLTHLLYDRALTSTQLTVMNNYLLNKFNIARTF